MNSENSESGQPRHFWHRVWHGKIHLQRGIVALSAVILTLLIFVQVVTRYLFNYAIFGIEELATYVAVWFYMLGAGIGAHSRGHISASLVDLVLTGELGQLIVKAFTALVGVVLCGWMTLWAVGFAGWSFKRDMMSIELGISMGWVHIAIPIGLGLMTLYFFVELIDDVRAMLRGKRS